MNHYFRFKSETHSSFYVSSIDMWYLPEYFYVMHIIMLCTHTHSAQDICMRYSERWCKQISIFHSKSIMNFGIFVEKSQCQPDSSTAQSLKVISLIFKFQFQHCYTHWWATSIWLMLLPPLLLLLLRLLVILQHSKKLVSTEWESLPREQNSSHTAHGIQFWRTPPPIFIFQDQVVQTDALHPHVCTHMCVRVNLRNFYTLRFCSCHSGARVAKKMEDKSIRNWFF